MVEGPVERRLAAIMVGDIVGYSRLMEHDEAGTLAAVRGWRTSILEPMIGAQGGRIVKMMGDGALIEFASAVKAVAAALDLQRAMAEANRDLPETSHIVLRIGVNLGDVVGEGADVYGEGVNIAARLEPLAEPGGICISAKVYEEVRGKIDAAFEEMGEKKHVDRAIMLNPNDADTLANATYLLMIYGEADRAVACAEAAMRLNPRYPDWYVAFHASALFAARRYQDSYAARLKAPDYFIDSTFVGAATIAQLDRPDEAKQWADRAVARLQATPGWREQASRGCIQLLLDNNPFRRQEDLDHFADAMRKAGVPG